jgi:hypothetical protein
MVARDNDAAIVLHVKLGEQSAYVRCRIGGGFSGTVALDVSPNALEYWNVARWPVEMSK